MRRLERSPLLQDSQKAAILMLALSRQASARLFAQMSHDLADSLSGTRISASQPVRAEVVQEFLSSLGRLADLGPVADLQQLEQVVRDHPRLVMGVMRKTWPGVFRDMLSRRSRRLRHPAKLP